MCLDLVDSLLFSIGQWISFDLEQTLLRLKLLSRNFERECPMVSFIKLFACVGLFGERTLQGGPLISIFWELGGKHVQSQEFSSGLVLANLSLVLPIFCRGSGEFCY